MSGLHYKAFLVTVRTCAEELVEQALQRAHITDSSSHYCIWQVATSNSGEGHALFLLVWLCVKFNVIFSLNAEMTRVLESSECPLALQLCWPQLNGYHFELRIRDNIHRAKVLYIAINFYVCNFKMRGTL